jgi:hypothetical protein
MNNVRVPEEWSRNKKTRLIFTTLLSVCALLIVLILVN